MFTETKKGFTLLELLIVIAIIAILSAILIFVLNPAETLKKGRDSQRISDFATMNTAVALLITTVGSPTVCGAGLATNSTSNIYVDVPVTDLGVDCGAGPPDYIHPASLTERYNTNGTGWSKTNLSALGTSLPISVLPVDPNPSKGLAACLVTDRFYRFRCTPTLTWELDGTLESEQFTVTDKRAENDGGNSTSRYEVGTNLTILPPTM